MYRVGKCFGKPFLLFFGGGAVTFLGQKFSLLRFGKIFEIFEFFGFVKAIFFWIPPNKTSQISHKSGKEILV